VPARKMGFPFLTLGVGADSATVDFALTWRSSSRFRFYCVWCFSCCFASHFLSFPAAREARRTHQQIPPCQAVQAQPRYHNDEANIGGRGECAQGRFAHSKIKQVFLLCSQSTELMNIFHCRMRRSRPCGAKSELPNTTHVLWFWYFHPLSQDL